MSEPLLNVMKIMLLAGLYLFFVRVLWSVFSELRDPRTVARKRQDKLASSAAQARTTTRRSAPASSASAPIGSSPLSGSPVVPSPAAAYGTQPGGVATAVAAGQLMVIEPPELAGMTYGLGAELTLGRAHTNGIVLDDTYVSTVHARIFLTNGTYFVEDLASRNGSTLNGQPLVATTALVPGDRLQLGATTMEFGLMPFAFRIGAGTHVGVSRQINQDSYATSPELAVVADGMGGHRGGEVASAIAADEMVSQFTSPELDVLVKGVENANTRILDEAAADPNLHGMGTTCVALGLIEVADGIALGAINVGDSRMYRLTGNVLEQLTEDHSLVEALVREGRITAAEAEVHPQRNIVTRALGVVEHVEVDSFHFTPKIGDRYLLCSDGLFNEVDAHGIATILATEPDPQQAAEKLIAAANEGGGRDNITTVIVDIVEADEGEMPARTTAYANELVVEQSEPTNEHAAVVVDEPASTASMAPKQRWSWRR